MRTSVTVSPRPELHTGVFAGMTSKQVRDRVTQSTQWRKKKHQLENPVQVHLIKLKDLPEALTEREFRDYCVQLGLPMQSASLTP